MTDPTPPSSPPSQPPTSFPITTSPLVTISKATLDTIVDHQQLVIADLERRVHRARTRVQRLETPQPPPPPHPPTPHSFLPPQHPLCIVPPGTAPKPLQPQTPNLPKTTLPVPTSTPVTHPNHVLAAAIAATHATSPQPSPYPFLYPAPDPAAMAAFMRGVIPPTIVPPPPPPPPNAAGGLVNAAGAANVRLAAENGERKQSRYWTADEHERFLAAAHAVGPKNYVQISEIVGTRNARQVRTHAQKYQQRLDREERKRRQEAGLDEGGVGAAAAVVVAEAAKAAMNGQVPGVGVRIGSTAAKELAKKAVAREAAMLAGGGSIENSGASDGEVIMVSLDGVKRESKVINQAEDDGQNNQIKPNGREAHGEKADSGSSKAATSGAGIVRNEIRDNSLPESGGGTVSVKVENVEEAVPLSIDVPSDANNENGDEKAKTSTTNESNEETEGNESDSKCNSVENDDTNGQIDDDNQQAKVTEEMEKVIESPNESQDELGDVEKTTLEFVPPKASALETKQQDNGAGSKKTETMAKNNEDGDVKVEQDLVSTGETDQCNGKEGHVMNGMDDEDGSKKILNGSIGVKEEVEEAMGMDEKCNGHNEEKKGEKKDDKVKVGKSEDMNGKGGVKREVKDKMEEERTLKKRKLEVKGKG